ncbi:response regulator transcription factor (plasmid) [Mesorhizobium terrae]
MKPLVAICSQDADFYLLLSHILEVEGFSSASVSSVDDVAAMALEPRFRAIVLDCRPDNQLAQQSAWLKQDPRTSNVPCVALVHAGAEAQHLQLLRSGVDQCFVRPFAPAMLIEYLHSRLNPGRPRTRVPPSEQVLTFGDVEMQIDAYRVYCAGKEIALGPLEFKLLRHMLENPQKVFSRKDLIGVAWPNTTGVSTRTVDVHISQLRKLLNESSSCAAIRTVRLAGYALEHRAG